MLQFGLMKKLTAGQLSKLRAKHDDALWKIEKLWHSLEAQDDSSRRVIIQAAAELAKIGQDLNKLEGSIHS